MRKFCCLLLALLFFCSASGMDAFCEEAHVHTGAWVTELEPTCTANGSATMVCTDCGASVSKSLPASHQWNAAYAVDCAPTYALPGSQSIHCAVCDAIDAERVETIPPLTLSAPEISASSDGFDQISITWTPVEGAEGYRIYRKTAAADWAYSDEEDWVCLDTTESTSYLDAAVFCGVSYSYAVTAVCGENEGNRAEVCSVQNTLSVPELEASPLSDFQISLDWTPVSGADGYRLYRKSGAGNWEVLRDLSGNDTTLYLDETGLWNTKYAYTIRAFRNQNGAYGFSDWDSEGCCVTTAQVTPEISVRSDYAKTTVSWKQIRGAEGYRIYRKPADSTKWKRIATLSGGETRRYIDKAASYGVSYDYTIRGYRHDGDRILLTNDCSPGVRGRVFLDTPTLRSVSAKSYAKIKITWEPVAGAQGYDLYRKSGTGSWKKIRTLTGQSAASYTDASVLTGTAYTYTVRAYRTENGTHLRSAYDKTGKSATPSLSVPTLKSATSAGYQQIKVTWESVAGADGYLLYRKTEGGSWKRLLTLKGHDTQTATDNTAVTGTHYFYTVKAYRLVDGEKRYSGYDKSGIKGTAKLSKPALQETVSAGYHKIKLTWKKVPGASGYEIYRADSEDGTYSKIETVKGASNVTFTDTKRTCGTCYYYKVRAYRSVEGNRVYSGMSKIGSAKPQLAKTKAKCVSGGYDRVKLSWHAVGGASGYQIYRKTSKNGTLKLLKEIAKPDAKSYTDSSCTCGKTYYYAVRAFRTVNGKPVFGKFSSTLTAKALPAAPSASAKSGGYDRVKLSWKMVSGASGYEIYRASSKNGSYSRLKTIKGNKTLSYTDHGLEHQTRLYYKIRSYRTVDGKKLYSPYSKVLSAKPVSVPDDQATGKKGVATGTLSWPAPGYSWLSSSWGDGRGHKGIDIAGSGIHGSDVLAVDGGVVKEVNDYSSWGSGYGYYVILDHGNNHTTMYAHCSKICVKEGQKIAKGQRIAKIGNTGDSTGPHLHFEIRYRGSPTDPMEFFE